MKNPEPPDLQVLLNQPLPIQFQAFKKYQEIITKNATLQSHGQTKQKINKISKNILRNFNFAHLTMSFSRFTIQEKCILNNIVITTHQQYMHNICQDFFFNQKKIRKKGKKLLL